MLGNKIRELRLKNGFTQEFLAKKLFVSPQAVSKWEQSVTLPEISLLVPLADLLGVTVDALLRESGESSAFEDTSALLEVKIIKPIESSIIHGRIRNISPYSFKQLKYKAKFIDSKGDMVDFCIDKISAFYPGDIKGVSLLSTTDTEKIDSIAIDLLEFSLI